ncbi:MAG TPA: DUF1015 domain-containing protein [Bacteroidetes bacterium]|nr:DUF1015 domain-containing protein [Bacteroidota bacterium]
MAVFKPFIAFRPKRELAAEVASKPYDVLSSEEAFKEAEGHPYSFLHIGKPEIDLPREVDLYDEKVYLKAKENLDKLVKDGILIPDEDRYFYLYSLTMDGRTQDGFVGTASVEDYWNDVIKKHEKTRKDKEEDRANHIRYTRSHSGPIFLTFRDDPNLLNIIKQIKIDKPEIDFIASDGVRNQVWVIKDKTLIKAIEQNFGNTKNLYVADGHHRSAAAAIVGKELKGANPNHNGEEEYNYFLAVAFPASHLNILDYNRVVKDLNGLTEDEFLKKLSQNFIIEEATHQVNPNQKGQFGMYLKGQWYKLDSKPEILKEADPVEKLDVSIMQKYVLSNILGIEDPRTDKRIDFIGGIRGLGELERRVNSGEMTVAFAMYPTSIDELLAIADAGKVLPPKSTWFEPKLRDGLFVHFF